MEQDMEFIVRRSDLRGDTEGSVHAFANIYMCKCMLLFYLLHIRELLRDLQRANGSVSHSCASDYKLLSYVCIKRADVFQSALNTEYDSV